MRHLWPKADREEIALQRQVNDDSAPTHLKYLIAQGWDHLYVPAFGEQSIDGLAPHHIEAIEWHWESRIDLLEGRKPTYDAYFPIWSRGHNKSGIARRLSIMDGLLSYAYGRPGYALYLSRNKEMALKHSKSVETLLQSRRSQSLCAALATEQVNEQKRSKGWTAKFIYTAANMIYHFAGLDEGLAGGNLETNAEEGGDDRADVRVTFFVLDDIDGREDSPVISESRFNTLTNEVLPMGQEDSLAFFAENLISRFSTMYRIHTQQAKVLTGRKKTEPIPAVIDFKHEQVTTKDGIIQDRYVSGEPTWKVWDPERIQLEINRFGLPAFLRECQHEVEQSKEGVILYNYDDNTHVISESEFAAVFGSVDAWLTWRKKPGNDWARTKTDKHANVAAWLTKSDQDTPLPNFTFLMCPMSFPANSAPEDVAERVLSCLSPYAYGKVTWADLRKEVLRRSNSDAHAKTVAEKIDYEHGELAKVVPQYAQPLLQRCNVQQGEMSHEQDTVRKLYSRIYSLGMRPINPKRSGGIEDINRVMRVDYETEHAFRPGVVGYSQFHLVVPDELQEPYRAVNGKPVYHPRTYPLAVQTNDLVDSDLCRFHLSNCRYRPPILTAAGEEIDVIEKLYDDFFNVLQFFYVGSELAGTSLTHAQKVKLLIPQNVQESVKSTQTGFMDYEFHKELAEAALRPANYDPLEEFE